MEEKDVKHYSPERLREVLDFLRPLFDTVRLVDPADSAVLTLGEQGAVIREPEACFRLWGRNCRCENCASLQAVLDGKHCTKCEQCGKERFFILSRPLVVDLPWRELPVVMEIVSRIEEGGSAGPAWKMP